MFSNIIWKKYMIQKLEEIISFCTKNFKTFWFHHKSILPLKHKNKKEDKSIVVITLTKQLFFFQNYAYCNLAKHIFKTTYLPNLSIWSFLGCMSQSANWSCYNDCLSICSAEDHLQHQPVSILFTPDTLTSLLSLEPPSMLTRQGLCTCYIPLLKCSSLLYLWGFTQIPPAQRNEPILAILTKAPHFKCIPSSYFSFASWHLFLPDMICLLSVTPITVLEVKLCKGRD